MSINTRVNLIISFEIKSFIQSNSHTGESIHFIWLVLHASMQRYCTYLVTHFIWMCTTCSSALCELISGFTMGSTCSVCMHIYACMYIRANLSAFLFHASTNNSYKCQTFIRYDCPITPFCYENWSRVGQQLLVQVLAKIRTYSLWHINLSIWLSSPLIYFSEFQSIELSITCCQFGQSNSDHIRSNNVQLFPDNIGRRIGHSLGNSSPHPLPVGFTAGPFVFRAHSILPSQAGIGG